MTVMTIIHRKTLTIPLNLESHLFKYRLVQLVKFSVWFEIAIWQIYS